MQAADAADLAVPARRRTGILGLLGWVSFDLGLIPCVGMISIFVFAPYFVMHVIGDAVRGQALLGYMQAGAGLLIALIAPVLGAVADASGPRKPWIAVFAVPTVLGMFGLAFAEAGSSVGFWIPLLCLGLLALVIELMVVFHNALLPVIATEQTIGRWSGLGYAVGNSGTVVGLAMIGVLVPATLDLSAWGLGEIDKERALGPLLALWMLACFYPFFRYTPDKPPRAMELAVAARAGVRNLVSTLRQVNRYRNSWTYFLARMAFQDGLLAINLFAGVFAAGVFGWQTRQLAVLGATAFLTTAAGAALGGIIDDRIGAKRTMLVALSIVIIATSSMIAITLDIAGSAAAPGPLSGLATLGFRSLAEQLYLGTFAICGAFIGPVMASSRSMVARLAPHELMGQFFGIFSLMGRVTSFLAPLVIGVVTSVTHSQRAGFSMVLGFLIVGLVLLTRVKEVREALV
jgi:MFS transporter, UMF1 family